MGPFWRTFILMWSWQVQCKFNEAPESLTTMARTATKLGAMCAGERASEPPTLRIHGGEKEGPRESGILVDYPPRPLMA